MEMAAVGLHIFSSPQWWEETILVPFSKVLLRSGRVRTTIKSLLMLEAEPRPLEVRRKGDNFDDNVVQNLPRLYHSRFLHYRNNSSLFLLK